MSYVQVSTTDVFRWCEKATEGARAAFRIEFREHTERWAGHSRFWRWFMSADAELDYPRRKLDHDLRRVACLTSMAACGGSMLLDDRDAKFLAKYREGA